jgi:hypothetical protein
VICNVLSFKIESLVETHDWQYSAKGHSYGFWQWSPGATLGDLRLFAKTFLNVLMKKRQGYLYQ